MDQLVTEPDPRSGLDADGKWKPAFEGQRPPFEEGNRLASQHGAYATLALTPRAAAITDWIRGLAPHLTPADEPALQTLGMTLAQLSRAADVLGEVDEAVKRGDDVDVYLGRIESRARLSADARRWTDTARKLMHELALTTSGRREHELALQIVVNVTEMQIAFDALMQLTAEYVAHERRTEYLEALGRVNAELAEGRNPFALPAPVEGDS